MRTERPRRRLPVPARRVFRLSFSIALALAGAHALAIPLPYLAPIFALVLGAAPAPPMPGKGLIGLVLLVFLTTALGLTLVTVLIHYPFVGLVLVWLGLLAAQHLSVRLGKGAVGAFLTIGLTLITAAGVASFVLAVAVAESLIVCIVLAVLSQRIVYPWFPEEPTPRPAVAKTAPDPAASGWIALRATLIVFPAYLAALVNPSLYLPVIMKSVSLGQQGSVLEAENAGRELLASTFLGGCFAILFWFALKIEANLWMFFLWMLFFAMYFAAKLYRVIATRFPPSFWINVVVTMLILLGPAVADSADGKDPYKGFAVRMALFVAVTVYAWFAIVMLEQLRAWRRTKTGSSPPALEEVPSC